MAIKKKMRAYRFSELFDNRLADLVKWLPAKDNTHAIEECVGITHTKLKMERKKMFKSILNAVLEDEKVEFLRCGGSEKEWSEALAGGEFSVEIVETRHDLASNIVEPKLQLVNLGGTWEAWANDGESAKDYRWQEVEG